MATALELLRALRAAKPELPKTGGQTLAEFAQSGRVVRLWSDVLQEELLFAADNARVESTEERVVYRARELAVIYGDGGDITPEALRLLHEVKTVFGGEVEDDPTGERETNLV